MNEAGRPCENPFSAKLPIAIARSSSSSSSALLYQMYSDGAPPRLLHDGACCLISCTHACLEKVTHMPFPIGHVIKCFETAVDRLTHPLIQSLEYKSLTILAVIDDKIYTIGSFAIGCVICMAACLKEVVTLLSAHGVIGTSAHFWAQYEGLVQKDVQKAVHIANQVPLLNLITPVFCTFSTPIVKAISNWLLRQAERTEKDTQTTESSFEIFREHERREQYTQTTHGNLEMCKERVEVESSHTKLEDENMKGDMHFASKDGSVDDVHLDGKDGSVDIVIADAGVDVAKDENVDYLPDVLEMIESSWLLGKAVSSTTQKKDAKSNSTSSLKIQNLLFSNR